MTTWHEDIHALSIAMFKLCNWDKLCSVCGTCRGPRNSFITVTDCVFFVVHAEAKETV